MPKLTLDAGTSTEALIQHIIVSLTGDELDSIEIDRKQDESQKLATEPLTIAATITISTTLTIAVCRIIERWMEKQSQISHMTIVAEGYKISDAAGKGLASLAEQHAKVSVKFGLPTIPLVKSSKS